MTLDPAVQQLIEHAEADERGRWAMVIENRATAIRVLVADAQERQLRIRYLARALCLEQVAEDLRYNDATLWGFQRDDDVSERPDGWNGAVRSPERMESKEEPVTTASTPSSIDTLRAQTLESLSAVATSLLGHHEEAPGGFWLPRAEFRSFITAAIAAAQARRLGTRKP